MRNLLFVVACIAAAVTFQAGAAHATAYWDQELGRFVDYSNIPVGGGAAMPSYTPIPREDVAYDGPYGPNTIVVDTAERRLYYVYAPGRALRYGVGVGREGFQWSGINRITRKAEWPGWTPPPQMVARERARGNMLPAYMEGGENNPLGARAL
jgi:lipoprotein-anchoring transpeptidase ErfK/SrfK